MTPHPEHRLVEGGSPGSKVGFDAENTAQSGGFVVYRVRRRENFRSDSDDVYIQFLEEIARAIGRLTKMVISERERA